MRVAIAVPDNEVMSSYLNMFMGEDGTTWYPGNKLPACNLAGRLINALHTEFGDTLRWLTIIARDVVFGLGPEYSTLRVGLTFTPSQEEAQRAFTKALFIAYRQEPSDILLLPEPHVSKDEGDQMIAWLNRSE